MQIEFRQVLNSIPSHRTVRVLVAPYKTLFTFDYQPNRKDPEPFVFCGTEILKLAGKKEDDFLKGYFVGVETEPSGKIKYHILDNFQDILTVNKHTNFKLFDVVLIIR